MICKKTHDAKLDFAESWWIVDLLKTTVWVGSWADVVLIRLKQIDMQLGELNLCVQTILSICQYLLSLFIT